MEKMKAIVYTSYGGPDVLKIQDVQKPYPKDNEILIRTRAVAVNYGDTIARNFKHISPREFNMPFLFWLLARFSFGLNNPKKKILGNTFAGDIELIGNTVKQFKAGDLVFGYTGESMGACAEYLCTPENGIVAVKPSNMNYEEAASIPYGTIIALNLLRKANPQKGQKILIIGASESIGSAAVQLAKNYYGTEVTGVCSTPGLDYLKNLGADKVIDYTKEDFTQSKEIYDIIFDILGKSTFSKCKNLLKQKGIYLLSSFKSAKLLQMLWTSLTGGKKVVCVLVTHKTEDLLFVKQLAEEGKIKPLVDKIFPLEQTAEAHRYIETGNKKGNVVIRA
jgi:NADPH:quinone reductase-like Zn-dependent oxidoreductase